MVLHADEMSLLSEIQVQISSSINNKMMHDFLSHDSEGALEFKDYQPYSYGESIRHVDWNRYQSEKQLVVRQYRRQEKPDVSLIADLSCSVTVANKSAAVKHLASALCYCLLCKGLSAKLFSHGCTSRYTGYSSICRMMDEVAALDDGTTAIHHLAELAMGSQGVIIISDFIYRGGFEEFKQQYEQIDTSCLLINLSTREDKNPLINGSLILRDAEDHSEVRCLVNEQTIQQYQKSRHTYYQQIEDYCMRRAWRFVDIDIDDDFNQQLHAIAPDGILHL